MPPVCDLPRDPVDEPTSRPFSLFVSATQPQQEKFELLGWEPTPPPQPVKKPTKAQSNQTDPVVLRYQPTRNKVADYLEKKYAEGGCCIQCRNCREVIDLVRYAELEAAEIAKKHTATQKESFLRLSTPKKNKPQAQTSTNKENEMLVNTSILSGQKSTSEKMEPTAGTDDKTKEIERRRLELLLILEEVGGLTKSQMPVKKSAFDVLDEDVFPTPINSSAPFDDLPQFGGASNSKAPSFAKPRSASGSKVGKKSVASANASKKEPSTPPKKPGSGNQKSPSPTSKQKPGVPVRGSTPKKPAPTPTAKPSSPSPTKPVLKKPTTPAASPRSPPPVPAQKKLSTPPSKSPTPAVVTVPPAPGPSSSKAPSFQSAHKGMSLASFGMPVPKH